MAWMRVPEDSGMGIHNTRADGIQNWMSKVKKLNGSIAIQLFKKFSTCGSVWQSYRALLFAMP
jgi:hypothetical protein